MSQEEKKITVCEILIVSINTPHVSFHLSSEVAHTR